MVQTDDPPVGRGRWVEKTALQIIQEWALWEVLDSDFLTQERASSNYLSQRDANTTYLNKTDANTTYLSKTDANTTYLSKTDANTTYATKSELATKQDTIPNFSLISTQTQSGLTVKVYSDGLNVYVTFDGTATGLNTSSTDNGVTDILTISNTYAPKIQTQVPARGQADTHRVRITANGVVQFLNGSTSATSYTIAGAFYYPLKSRIP